MARTTYDTLDETRETRAESGPPRSPDRLTSAGPRKFVSPVAPAARRRPQRLAKSPCCGFSIEAVPSPESPRRLPDALASWRPAPCHPSTCLCSRGNLPARTRGLFVPGQAAFPDRSGKPKPRCFRRADITCAAFLRHHVRVMSSTQSIAPAKRRSRPPPPARVAPGGYGVGAAQQLDWSRRMRSG